MLRLYPLAAAVLLLTACTGTQSQTSTADYLRQNFAGKKAQDFFLSYGKPAGKTVNNEGTLYRWVSLAPPREEPTIVYHSYPSPKGPYAIPEGGMAASPEPQFCELQIQADKKDTIRSFYIAHDSDGKWSNSYCSDIFR